MITKEEFLQANPELLKLSRMAHNLKSPELLDRTNKKINQAYEAFLQSKQHFNDEIPIEYVIGNIVVGRSTLNPNILIKADMENLSGHTLAIGATGSGKTHLILEILHQITAQYPNTNLRYIIFALKKPCEQRSLIINNNPGACLFLEKNTLALNPLSSVQNVDDETVQADAARVISNELGLMVGGQLYLQDKISEFKETFKEENLISFIKWISKKKETSFDLKGYHDRLVIRLRSLMFEVGNIFGCYKGIDDKHFVENNLIIELPSSSSFITSVVAGLILGRMFRYKAANQESLYYKNIIVLEDIQGAMNNA